MSSLYIMIEVFVMNSNIGGSEKSNETQCLEPSHKRQKERPKKAKRHVAYKNQRKERANPSGGRKLSHPQPF